jgi:hypothetical protein
MTPRLRRFLPAILVLLLGLVAYRHAQDAAAIPTRLPEEETRLQPLPIKKEPRMMPAANEAPQADDEELDIEAYGSCRANELILRLPTQESYEEFIKSAAENAVGIHERVDRLRAIRVRQETSDDHANLAEVLDKHRVVINKDLVHTPSPPKARGGISRKEALAFGDQLLVWLGVTRDNSAWGRGVKVAVLDSEIVPHPALPTIAQSVDTFPASEGGAVPFFHGTAVASLIAGNHPMARGIAPGVELISIRVINEVGKCDALSVASGLLAALDHGAEIVNLSLGCSTDLPIVRDTIRLAIDAGIVVVASAGNEGQSEARYPAAYEGVIAVGAIEAGAERMVFSNLGSRLGLTAPGYGLNAAAPGDRYISFGGTSASAPIVCGAIAATMSDGTGHRLRATEAVRIVFANADDEGLPGVDPEYGSGVVNLDRIMNRNQRGRYDAAITCQRILPPGEAREEEQVEVTIQNRGTEILVNSLTEISTPGGVTKINATTFAPGAVESFRAPLKRFQDTQFMTLKSRVSLSTGADLTPDNNARDAFLRFPRS